MFQCAHFYLLLLDFLMFLHVWFPFNVYIILNSHLDFNVYYIYKKARDIYLYGIILTKVLFLAKWKTTMQNWHPKLTSFQARMIFLFFFSKHINTKMARCPFIFGTCCSCAIMWTHALVPCDWTWKLHFVAQSLSDSCCTAWWAVNLQGCLNETLLRSPQKIYLVPCVQFVLLFYCWICRICMFIFNYV